MESKSRQELIDICKERGLKGYSGKSKSDLIGLLTVVRRPQPVQTKYDEICRLNYIGSKYQLLDWITDAIKTGTKMDLGSAKIADLFAGTGILSYHFRSLGAFTLSNDAELYSSIIASAFACSTYTGKCKHTINVINEDLIAGKHLVGPVGYIASNYSPYEGCERMFFTIENARRIDYVRGKIEDIWVGAEFTDAEYKFMVASLLMSADAVSNVPAVYGCYLKNFKAKALKNMELKAVHKCVKISRKESVAYNLDVLDDDLIVSVNRFGANIVYLDPPYNERQYSKNYFPLNMIAMTPIEQQAEAALKGKTGIPQSCFMSAFCKKGEVESAFTKLFEGLKVDYIFVSYNSESLLSKEKMMEIMGKYGSVAVIERDYKRFKSFEYNEDIAIKEYLFCLAKRLN